MNDGESGSVDNFAGLGGKIAIVDLALVDLLRTFGWSVIGIRKSENRITSHRLAESGSGAGDYGGAGAAIGQGAGIIETLAA